MTALLAATFTIPGTDFLIPTNVVILGTITGLTYTLIAVGITLVYRTSRVLNFAAGEMGALPAVLIPILVINNNWPYWLALSLSLLGALGAERRHGGVRHPAALTAARGSRCWWPRSAWPKCSSVSTC